MTPVTRRKTHFITSALDRFGRRRGLFLAFGAAAAAVSYALILGEAGYFVKRQLENDLNDVTFAVEDLRKENEALVDRYQRLEQESERPKVRVEREPILLKFEDGAKNESPAQKRREGPALGEARALFAVTAFLLLLGGFFLIPRRGESN